MFSRSSVVLAAVLAAVSFTPAWSGGISGASGVVGSVAGFAAAVTGAATAGFAGSQSSDGSATFGGNMSHPSSKDWSLHPKGLKHLSFKKNCRPEPAPRPPVVLSQTTEPPSYSCAGGLYNDERCRPLW